MQASSVNGTRRRTGSQQADSLTKSGRRVAGAIFDLLDEDGSVRVTEREIAWTLSSGRRLVQNGLRELVDKNVVQVHRNRGGTMVRWLSPVGGPADRGPSPKGDGSTRSTSTVHRERDPNQERLSRFRKELDEAKLDAIYRERAENRRTAADLRREATPETIAENLDRLQRVIAEQGDPERQRNRPPGPVRVMRPKHERLTEAEYSSALAEAAKLVERFGGADTEAGLRRLVRQRLREARESEAGLQERELDERRRLLLQQAEYLRVQEVRKDDRRAAETAAGQTGQGLPSS